MAEAGDEAGEMAVVRVTAVKTNAHFEVGKNKAGAPIMEIFRRITRWWECGCNMRRGRWWRMVRRGLNGSI